MKKIMVAAVVVCAATMSTLAGQCRWGYWGEAVNRAGEEFTSGTVLLYALTGSDTAPTFNSETGTWNMNGATLLATTSYSEDDLGWGSAGADFVDVPGVDPSSATQPYMALFITEKTGVSTLDGYEGWYTIALNEQASQEVIDPTGPTYGTVFETYDTTVTAGSWKEAAAAAVPEPTSGLLLLLGVAGLALKRKRA